MATHGPMTSATARWTRSATSLHPTFISHQLNERYTISSSGDTSSSAMPVVAAAESDSPIDHHDEVAAGPAGTNDRSSSLTERTYECRPSRLSWIRVWRVSRVRVYRVVRVRVKAEYEVVRTEACQRRTRDRLSIRAMTY